jgi:ABC-type transport system involved in multi-copper enzyme maturation permease subunit
MVETFTASSAAGTGTFLRDTALVARFELAEAVRSKLLIVMVLLFMGGGALGAWMFTSAVKAAEEGVAPMFGLKKAKPGETLQKMRETKGYRGMVYMLVQDEKKADYFAAKPPLVIFFGWAAFWFTPWLVVFTSAETIASEVASRAIRFSLLRTRRLAYAIGKAIGQLAIVIGVTAVSGVVFFLVAAIRLSGFEGTATALGMLSFWPRVVLYNLPMLAWAMFASMATASANLARILSLGGAVALLIVSIIAEVLAHGQGVAAVVGKGIGYLVPFGHWAGFMYPPGGQLWSNVLVCLALTALYFGAGFAILRKRDV